MVNVPVFSFTFQPVKSFPLNSEIQPSSAHARGVKASSMQSVARFMAPVYPGAVLRCLTAPPLYNPWHANGRGQDGAQIRGNRDAPEKTPQRAGGDHGVLYRMRGLAG